MKQSKDTLAVFTADEEFQETIDKWTRNGKYHKLLGLWVKGLIVDWNKLYGANRPQRMSLPTYPFAKERYWVNGISDLRFQISDLKNQLHPLVHENTSDLSEQRFSSTFTGEEFFLRDHHVQGRKILPGAAYLEIALVAMKQAADVNIAKAPTVIQLDNIVWASPLVVRNDPRLVHTRLFPGKRAHCI